MSSCAWNCSAPASSSSDIVGRSTVRTSTRGVATPTRTGPFLRLSSFHSRWIASVTAAGIDDLTVAHRAGGQRDLAEAGQARWIAGLELGDPDRVGPDVETDQTAGHGSVPPSIDGADHTLVEELGDVPLADPEVLADADRGQLAGLDQPIHGHGGDSHDVRDFTRGQKIMGYRRRHGYCPSLTSGTVSLMPNNRQHEPRELSPHVPK